MLLFRLLRLINTLRTTVSGFVRKRSHTIWLIDEIPTSILSLLSPDTCDDRHDKTDFLKYCRSEYWNNPSVLSQIDEFEPKYRSEQAIDWYTRDTFVYRIINRALRSGNIQLIDKCRFFFVDLHQLTPVLHKMRYQRDIVQPPRIYYRGTITLSIEFRSEIFQ